MNMHESWLIRLWFVPLLVTLGACGASPPGGQGEEVSQTAIRLQSSTLEPGGTIPTRYTCDGDDVSPPLSWSELPSGTESLALILDDPDAPGGTWVHWVLYNVPPDAGSLPEGVPTAGMVEGVGVQGLNSWRREGYGGPCPPRGSTHNYVWRLFALDAVLDLDPGATKEDVTQAMDGHILGEGRLSASYGR